MLKNILKKDVVKGKVFFQDFKAFAVKGNMIDMAVGVIIGGAFGKVVTSLVNDIIMPPLGYVIGGVNFKDLKLVLKDAVVKDGVETAAAVSFNYGNFLQNIFDFFVIAFSVFVMIKIATNLMKSKKVVPPEAAPAEPAKPSNEELLLTEIRDLLKERCKNCNADN